MMATTYKALGLFLMYPEAELQAVYPLAVAAIEAEGLIPASRLGPLRRLARQLAEDDLLDLQARFVQLFDRNRSLSLNLYEHVHGESRDRGMAMVELKELYASKGLEFASAELPDHLPVFLEFLSTLPPEDARELIGAAGHVIEAIAERLRKRRSPYRTVFTLLAGLASSPCDAQAVAALLREPEDDPDDLQALDRAWAEEPVTFGAGEIGCPKVRDEVARRTAPLASSVHQGVPSHAS